MWRTTFVSLPFLLFVFWGMPLAAENHGFQCTTCEENCEELGVQPGERICLVHGDVDADEDAATLSDAEVDQTEQPDQAAQRNGTQPASSMNFTTALVEWEFVPVIEVVDASGAVSPVDVQRTVQEDQQGIAECFEPDQYPGEGSVEVEMHLGYNGVPRAVRGNPEGMRPNQARCILRRAWGYEFPRTAEEADEDSRVQYRVGFVAQRRGLPDADRHQPELLLERVQSKQDQVKSRLSEELYGQLRTAERCAALTIEDLPHDLVVTEVEMTWTRSGERYVPSDVDITVTNQTGQERVSQEVLDCYQNTLTNWDVQLDGADLDELEGSFFITVRPAGWLGS